MADNVSVQATVTQAKAPVSLKGNDDHLQVILEQESYDDIMGLMTEASKRTNMPDSFDYWLARCIKVGAQTIVRPWHDRDVVSLYNLAAKGDSKAKEKLRNLLKL